jgi:hypothetical protein
MLLNKVYNIQYSGGTRAGKWRLALIHKTDEKHYYVIDLELNAVRTYRKDRVSGIVPVKSGCISFGAGTSERILEINTDELKSEGYEVTCVENGDEVVLVYWVPPVTSVCASIKVSNGYSNTIRPITFTGTLFELRDLVDKLVKEHY